MKICKNPLCGVEFEPDDATQIYCSDTCNSQAYKIIKAKLEQGIRICKQCGIEYPKDQGGTKYCSDKCKRAAANAKYVPAVKKEYNKVCRKCGESFTTFKKGQEYCTEDCSAAATLERQALYRKTAKAMVICETCGTAFPSRPNGSKYCKRECRKIGTLKNQEAARRAKPIKINRTISKEESAARLQRSIDNGVSYGWQVANERGIEKIDVSAYAHLPTINERMGR